LGGGLSATEMAFIGNMKNGKKNFVRNANTYNSIANVLQYDGFFPPRKAKN